MNSITLKGCERAASLLCCSKRCVNAQRLLPSIFSFLQLLQERWRITITKRRQSSRKSKAGLFTFPLKCSFIPLLGGRGRLKRSVAFHHFPLQRNFALFKR